MKMAKTSGLTPAAASPKYSRSSASLAETVILMKSVQGFLWGLPLVGVRVPVLEVSATGERASSPSALPGAGSGAEGASGTDKPLLSSGSAADS